MFHGLLHMINKVKIHAGIISRETQLNIILGSALSLSRSSLILVLRNLKTNSSTPLNLHPTFTRLEYE